MKSLLIFAGLMILGTGCVHQTANETTDAWPDIAFIYQNVGNFKNGASEIAVRLGISPDGTTVNSYGIDALAFEISQTNKQPYGDPVFSRLSDGMFAMTSWSSPDDPRGNGVLLYAESSCPIIQDDDVIALAASTADGCQSGRVTGGKTSQIFAAEGGNYVFHMINGEIYLAHMSDNAHRAIDLPAICILKNPVTTISDLNYGETTRILTQAANNNLLMSDTAMGQRADGTWVLFVKGIPKDNGCTPNTICELCGRSIYRTTSTDLIHWSEMEEVIKGASVPEATSTVDGVVWLYWQNFSQVCETQNKNVSSRAPISSAYEMDGSFELSEPINLSFPDEAFETNQQLHYATNANPIRLPDAAAKTAYEACAGR